MWLIQIKIRGFLSHIQQLHNGYWGITSMKAQSVLLLALPSPHSKDTKDENQQPSEATGVGRNWVQSMFSRNKTTRSSSFSHVHRWTSDGGNSGTWFLNELPVSLSFDSSIYCQNHFVLLLYNSSYKWEWDFSQTRSVKWWPEKASYQCSHT